MKPSKKAKLKKLLKKWGIQESVQSLPVAQREIVRIQEVLKEVIPKEKLELILSSLNYIWELIDSSKELTEKELVKLSDELSKVQEGYKSFTKDLEEAKNKEVDTSELEKKLNKVIEDVRKDVNRIKQFGGGSIPLQVQVNGTSSKKYAGFNLKAGTGVSLASVDNDTTRLADITFTNTGDITSAALTKTDDTNVTLTLGGTPTTALLQATSLTLGWTGQLSIARGGTNNVTAYTAGSIIYSDGTKLTQDNANFFWDGTNHVLSLGTTVNNVLDQVGAARPLVVQSASSTTTIGGSTNAIAIINSDTTTNNTSSINFGAITGASTAQYTDAQIVAIHGARTNGTYMAGHLAFLTSSATNFAPTEKLRIWASGGISVNNTTDPGAGNLSVTGTGSFSSTLHAGGDFDVATTKFTVAAASGNTSVAGTLGVTGAATFLSTATLATDGTANGTLVISSYSGLTRITSATNSAGGTLGLGREAVAVNGQPAGNYSVEIWGGTSGGTRSYYNDTTTAVNNFLTKVGIGVAPSYWLHVGDTAATSTTQGANIIGRFQANASGADVSIQLSDAVTYATQFGQKAGIFYMMLSGSTPVVEFDSNNPAMNLYGKAAKYNAITTTGWGVPAIYASGRATAQTAANTSVSTYTVGAADGSFIVSANVLVTTSSAENFTTTVTYTDEGNTARTLTLNFQLIGGVMGSAINFSNGAVPYEGIPVHIRAKASTAITVKTTGTFTGATYNVEGYITQIG